MVPCEAVIASRSAGKNADANSWHAMMASKLTWQKVEIVRLHRQIVALRVQGGDLTAEEQTLVAPFRQQVADELSVGKLARTPSQANLAAKGCRSKIQFVTARALHQRRGNVMHDHLGLHPNVS